jgi:hypothetical protein
LGKLFGMMGRNGVVNHTGAPKVLAFLAGRLSRKKPSLGKFAVPGLQVVLSLREQTDLLENRFHESAT